MNIRVSVFDQTTLFELSSGPEKISIIQTEANDVKNVTIVCVDRLGNHKVETYPNTDWTHSGFLTGYFLGLRIAENTAEKIKKNLDKALALHDSQVRGTVFNFEI